MYFFSSFFFLFCVIVGNGSGCFLEVVASSAGEKGGAYGSQDFNLKYPLSLKTHL